VEEHPPQQFGTFLSHTLSAVYKSFSGGDTLKIQEFFFSYLSQFSRSTTFNDRVEFKDICQILLHPRKEKEVRNLVNLLLKTWAGVDNSRQNSTLDLFDLPSALEMSLDAFLNKESTRNLRGSTDCSSLTRNYKLTWFEQHRLCTSLWNKTLNGQIKYPFSEENSNLLHIWTRLLFACDERNEKLQRYPLVQRKLSSEL